MLNCSHCKLPVKEDEDEFVQCDSCKTCFHTTKKCSITSSTEARVFTLQKRMLIFFCDDCLTSFKQVPQLLRKINKLEEDIVILKDEVKSLKSNPGNALNAETLYNEIQERARRSKNVLIHNLKESNLRDHKDRISHDIENAINILSPMEISSADIKVFRLGKPGNKPRPLKVIFDNEEAALTCIKNRRKVVSLNPNIRISADTYVISANTYAKRSYQTTVQRIGRQKEQR
ncbi:hypothetical protein JTB14_008139 [Gonioctena quinquepunctata]|nr:hypothetical protein JTB14_008139 [Gonioctena quinquepunctata]